MSIECGIEKLDGGLHRFTQEVGFAACLHYALGHVPGAHIASGKTSELLLTRQ